MVLLYQQHLTNLCFFSWFFFNTLEKAWSCWFWIAFIQTEVLFMWPTFHSCIPSPSHVLIPKCVSICACMCVCVCAITSEGRVCVSECVWLRSFVRLSHRVQSCSCVSRVDVLKWGHFLSVWCLRNNPTAQKLLQPSASTYLSLYLYCSGYAFLFYNCPLHAVW